MPIFTTTITGSSYTSSINNAVGFRGTSSVALSASFVSPSGLPVGSVSNSLQVNHSETNGYISNEHINHTGVSVSAGDGLSGGGAINLTRTLTLNTSSAHFTGGVVKGLPSGVVSSSVQINTGSFSGSIVGTFTSTVSPVYNVRAYGATGNGTTDDYTALSASLSAITTAGGGTLYLPKGSYRIGQGLRISSNTTIRGDGRENTIIHCNHLTTLPGTAMVSGSALSNVIIEDLCLSGSGINGASSQGIRFTLGSGINNDQIVLRNLFVNDQAGTGISIDTPILTTIQNVKVRFVAGDGFAVVNGTSTNFYECFAVTGLGAGFDLDTMTYSSLNGCASEVFGISFKFRNCSAISVISCGSEDPINRSAIYPGYTGISFRNSETGTTSRVALYSCYSRDPRTAAPSGHISGSFQTINFRAESGSQVLTPFKIYGNSEFVGQLSASAYTSSLSSGVGFVGTASYALASAGGGGGGTPAGATGQVQFNDGGVFGGAAQLFYDKANNRVGINTGTNTPTHTLQVNGTVSASSYIASSDYFVSASDVPVGAPITLFSWSPRNTDRNYFKKITNQGGLGISCDSSMVLHAGDQFDAILSGVGITSASTVEDLFVTADASVFIYSGQTSGFTTSNSFEFSTTGRFRINSTGSAAAPSLSYMNDTNTGIYSGGPDTIGMTVGGTARLFVSQSNVGINTTTPLYRLDVNNGDVRITSGSLGVYATPNATDGRIDASNDIVAFSSDRRLKTNVTHLSNAMSKINSLQGFTYNWNALAGKIANYDTASLYVGVYAQDVRAVLPEAVKLAPFDNDGHDNSISGENYLTVQYEKLVPLLIEAIKELKVEVDELKRKL